MKTRRKYSSNNLCSSQSSKLQRLSSFECALIHGQNNKICRFFKVNLKKPSYLTLNSSYFIEPKALI
jgi:hypothetical protein